MNEVLASGSVHDIGARNPRKVLVIISGLGTGGAEAMLVKLAERIDKERFSISVISLLNEGTRGKQLTKLGVRVDCLNLKGLLSLPGAVFRLRLLVKQHKPDIIQGWMYHGNIASSIARLFLLGRRVPVIWNVRHSLHDLAHESAALRLLIRCSIPLSRTASTCIYASARACQQHIAIGYSARMAVVIPNGFDMTRFAAPDMSERHSFRRALGLELDDFVVVHLARFHPMKDHLGFLRAIATVVQAMPKVKVLMAGTNVSDRNAELTTLIDELGLKPYVILMGELQDVRQPLSAADTLCLSSAWGEAFPNVVGEAMAMRVPCVVTDVGDSAAIVGDTGLVVHPGAVSELANALKRMAILTPDERAQLGEKSRQKVTTQFSLDNIVRLYETCYLRACGHV